MFTEGWTRTPQDCIGYDSDGNPVGKLYKTYGINILEIGEALIKVFSPDLNKNVFIKKEDLERK